MGKTVRNSDKQHQLNPQDQPQFTYKMSWSQAKKKLGNFYNVYFQKSKVNLKLALLPQWMDEYGRLLSLENHRRIPKFLTVLKPGTIVMVNFGVGVGSEMSLNHFAIVLSKNDTKYKHNVIVVPLSSKKHPKEGYLPLGKIITQELAIRFQERSEEMHNEAKQAKESINYLMDHASFNAHIPVETYDYFFNHGLDLRDFSKHLIEYDNYKNTLIYNRYQKALKINAKFKDHDVTQLLDALTEIFKRSDNILNSIKEMEYASNELEVLFDKANKYNKQTYADVGNITTVSKLRIIKFSKFNISENTQVSQEIVNKILDRLHDFI